MLSWALRSWSLCFVIRGLRTDSHSNSLKGKGVHYEISCCLEMGSHHEGGKSTCYPCCHLVSFTFLLGQCTSSDFPASKRALCGLITVSTEFHFSQGILAILMSSALCSSVLIIDYFLLWFSLYISWEGNFTDSADLFLARLLDSFRTGWPCIRWPSLATRPGRFTWMGLQVHQSLTCCILGF